MADSEVDLIAALLGMDACGFAERYTRLTHDRKSLALVDQEDGSCVFYRHGEPPACFIQKAKPAQCRGFPVEWAHAGWENDCGSAIAARQKK